MNPNRDGIDHINIYSQGKTELGRWLSNFQRELFTCEDGSFVSIEGYWYWLKTENDILRSLAGFEAKKMGKTFPRIKHQFITEAFKIKIRKAINIKITGNKRMYESFKQSTLPFAHYYVYGDKVVNTDHEWILEHIERIRTIIKGK